MRSLHQLRSPVFAAGFTLGLVLTGVTFALSRAVMRRSRRTNTKELAHPIIDGAKPIDPVNLTLGPVVEEGAGSNVRLESEMVDSPVNSQRW